MTKATRFRNGRLAAGLCSACGGFVADQNPRTRRRFERCIACRAVRAHKRAVRERSLRRAA